MADESYKLNSSIPITRVVTHSGMAHRDDFIAACIASTLTNDIVRLNDRSRDPKEKDENAALLHQYQQDEHTIVLDVGLQDNPDLNNFDHHQDRDGKLGIPCSLTLLAKKFGLHEEFKKSAPWYDIIDFRDRNGPAKLAQELGISEETMTKLEDPVMNNTLKNFSRFQGKVNENFVETYMRPLGEQILRSNAMFLADYKRIEECKIEEIGGLRVLVDTCNPPSDIDASKAFCRNNHIDVTVRENTKDNTTTVTRTTSDETKIDFRLLKESHKDQLQFVHNTGFMMVVKGTETEPALPRALAAVQHAAELPKGVGNSQVVEQKKEIEK